MNFKKYWHETVLLTLSVVTHTLFFGYPNEAVFDEVHFTSFLSSYLSHSYFFDIHPPFAKLFILLFGLLSGLHPLAEPLTIGSVMPHAWLLLRLVPLFFGILLPLVIYRLCKVLRMSTTVAVTSALLIIFENSILTQSRFILLDSMLLFFGFLGLLLYFLARARESRWLKIAAIASLTLAFSVKWTGATFIALAFCVELYDFYKKRPPLGRSLINWAILFFVIPLSIYASFFAIHFAILTNSGPGDAFMSPIFQKTLKGNEYAKDTSIRSTSFIEKFLVLNAVMLESNQRLNATHQYSSRWYTWPIEERPIFYWQKNETPTAENVLLNNSTFDLPETSKLRPQPLPQKPQTMSLIYYFGNPFVYLLSLSAILVLCTLLLIQIVSKKIILMRPQLGWFIVGAYFLNFLPFMGIGRVMFLYHYLSALLFGIIGIAYLIDQMPSPRKKIVSNIFIVIAALTFIYFAPITYGLPINIAHESWYFWLPTWR